MKYSVSVRNGVHSSSYVCFCAHDAVLLVALIHSVLGVDCSIGCCIHYEDELDSLDDGCIFEISVKDVVVRIRAVDSF